MDKSADLRKFERFPKRKRKKNFGEQEILLLSEIVRPYKDIVENKGCTTSIIAQKNRSWDDITKQFNANSPNYPREQKELREMYYRLKVRAKRQSVDGHRSRDLTGSLSKPNSPCEASNRTMEVITQEFVTLENQYDCEADTAAGLITTDARQQNAASWAVEQEARDYMAERHSLQVRLLQQQLESAREEAEAAKAKRLYYERKLELLK